MLKSDLAGAASLESGAFGAADGQAVGAVLKERPWSLDLWSIMGVSLLGAAFFWSYWPTLARLVLAWTTDPDYAHGYLAMPTALLFCWTRRRSRPGVQPRLAWAGLLLILAALGIRATGDFFYLEALDGWSIPLWLAGACWLFAGPRWTRWALPALGLLWFMVPLPYRLECLFDAPIQRSTTLASCWLLQLSGLPALADGNVILLGRGEMDVAEVCGGLRTAMPAAALAFAFAAISRRPRWIKVCLLASVLPISMASCALRVTVAGLFYGHLSDASAGRLWLGLVGWTTLPVAAVLLGGLLWYLVQIVLNLKPLEAVDLQGRAPGVAL